MLTSIDHYRVSWELTEKQWDKLEKLDYTSKVRGVLEPLGANDIDYNGIFGMRIMCTVESLCAANAIRLALQKMLK